MRKSGSSWSISAVFDSFWSNHFLAHLECEMIMWQLLVQASRPFSLVGNICIGKRWSFNEGVIFIKQGAKYRIRVASLMLHSDRCGVREKKCGDVTPMRLKCVLMLIRIYIFWLQGNLHWIEDSWPDIYCLPDTIHVTLSILSTSQNYKSTTVNYMHISSII